MHVGERPITPDLPVDGVPEPTEGGAAPQDDVAPQVASVVSGASLAAERAAIGERARNLASELHSGFEAEAAALSVGDGAAAAAGLSGKEPRSATWDGPVLTPEMLQSGTAGLERRMVEANGGNALVLPYGGFDPEKPPVVLIHGAASASGVRDLAERLHQEGRQVFVALYREMKVDTFENGKQMALQLESIREKHYPEGTPLDLVAHSMGGIAARSAVNYLLDPSWMQEEAPPEIAQRGGFGAMRLRTIDTPWSGFAHEPVGKSDTAVFGVVDKVMTAITMGGAMEMRGTSDTFANLYDVELDGVDIVNHAGVRPGKSDFVPSLPELKPAQALAVVRGIAFGEVPSEPRMKNLLGGLAQDARYPALQAAIGQAVTEGRLQLDGAPSADFLEVVTRIHDEVMPRFVGKHTKLVRDDPTHGNDAVDAIVRELTSPRP
jgi:hypothetical protein